MAFVDWVVRFTDSAESGRAMRLDLNEPGVIQVDGEIDLGQAQLERTMADVEGRDGEVMVTSNRVNRQVRIPLKIWGDSLAFSTLMGRITRESERRHNLLEFWPKGEGTAAPGPVFFVAQKGEISSPVEEADIWRFELTLLCEPAALSAKETGSKVIASDPAGTDKPMFTLPAVKGDVPAPLTVKVGAGTNTDATGPIMVSVCSGPTGFTTPYFVQAEALTQGTDTATQVNDAAMSGTGNNYSRVSFTTNNLTSVRLSGDVASVPPGRWRIWGRLRKLNNGDKFNVRLDVGTAASARAGQVVAYDHASTGPHLVDLGEVEHPYYQPDDVTAAENLTLRFFAERTAGSSGLDVDEFMLVPRDLRGNNEGAVVLVTPTVALGTGNRWRLSPDYEMAYPTVAAKPAPIGGGPEFRAVPGETTHVHVLHRTYPGVSALSGTNTIEWEYHPRFLFVAAP